MLACVAMTAQLGQQHDSTSRRRTTVVTVRVLVLCAVAVALGAIHIPGRPRTLCTLRSLTGVPCPFCGGTTAVADLGRGRFVDAVAASPLAVALALALPLRGMASLGRLWTRPGVRWGVIGVVLVTAELWQLQRFGLLPV
jgi:hypothetical protein